MKSIKLLLVIILSYSCSTMYIPTSPNIPLFTKENVVKSNIGLITTSKSFSGGYSISSKYALILNSAISYGNFIKYYDIGDILYNCSEFSYFDGGSYKHSNIDVGFLRIL